MAGTRDEPSKTNHGEITLDLSGVAGPAAEERQGDNQEDRRTGRRTEEGEGWGRGRFGMGTSPAGALAHSLCCHTKGGYHSRWPQRRRFFFFCFSPLSRQWAARGKVCRMGGQEGGEGCFSFGGTVQYIEESNIYLCFVVCRLKRGLVT